MTNIFRYCRAKNSSQQIVRACALVTGAVGLVEATNHPVGTVWGTILYLLAVALFAAFKHAWLFALPIAYSIGDLYPWTGRLLVTEADLICAAAASTLLWQNRTAAFAQSIDRRFLWLWTPLIVSCGVALVIGWNKLPAGLWNDDLSLYGTRLNSLRIAKGYLWGIFFAPFVVSELKSRSSGIGSVIGGVRTGAVIVAALVLWERFVTVGLLNTDDPYRATGPMFSSHIGGMQIDAFWAITVPILTIPPQSSNRIAAWIGYAFALLVAYLAVAATMSRGAVVVIACHSVLVAGVVMVNVIRTKSVSRRRVLASLAVTSGVVFGLLAMIFTSEAMWSRFATSRADWNVRWSHWSHLCRAASVRRASMLVGNGMGVVPSLLANVYGLPVRPAELTRTDHGDTVLRLVPGRAVYVEQLVSADAPGPWRLTVDADTTSNARLVYHVCRKTLYRSFECIEDEVLKPIESASHQPAESTIEIARLQMHETSLALPPVTFALSMGGDHARVDVKSVHLEDADGRDLLRNERFQNGSARWFFTSDDLSAWRADSLWVQLYVEQGFVGLLTFAWLTVGSFGQLLIRTRHNFHVAQIAFGLGIAGFIALGTIGSLVDTANITSLFLLCLAVVQAEIKSGDFVFER